MKRSRSGRFSFVVAISVFTAFSGGVGSLLGVCGPFTDVSDPVFCNFVLEIFYLGITTGTSPTTYDPSSSVSRLQMAAFLSRTVDAGLKRGGRRAALNQFWTPGDGSVSLTTVGNAPALLQSDGLDIWVASSLSGSVARVRGSDGRVLETWTGAHYAGGVLVAIGRVFVTGFEAPGNLYRIDPSQAAGTVTTVASSLGTNPAGIAFDGQRIWTANVGPPGSVSIVTPGATIPWSVMTVTSGFLQPQGALYDSASVWITDSAANSILKLSPSGLPDQTVTVGTTPRFPGFDGTNIWVPNSNSNSVSVVRASTGAVLRTLTGNGLNWPQMAAFDGQRILVTNYNAGSVSLFKAADLTPIGTAAVGGEHPGGACSDGVNFWITLPTSNLLVRF